MRTEVGPIALVCVLAALSAAFSAHLSTGTAENWPTYRSDAARSAYTTNAIPMKLVPNWTYTPPHAPNPAWSKQARLEYDHTYHPVLFEGLLFFGSSSDHKVYALDAITGKSRWSFFTDGPVRVAPAVSEHGLFVGSDDGFLYCLEPMTGKLKWKHRASPIDDRIMGNDRLISRWPVRGGPAIHDGRVYFTAGIWPTEGVTVCALDASDGSVVWKNDSCGTVISDKPRAGSKVESGPAGQGHLAVGAGVLVVPTGRAAPAVFDLKDGSLKYFHHSLYVNKVNGGTKAAVYDDQFVVFGENYPATKTRVNRTRVCAATNGEDISAGICAAHAYHPDMLVTSTGKGLAGYAKLAEEKERKQRNGEITKYRSLNHKPLWECRTPFPAREIVATPSAILIGGEQELAIIDIKTKAVTSHARLEGKVQSLAVANGRVYVATEDGTLHCFSDKGTDQTQPTRSPTTSSSDATMAAVAREILTKSKITQGYCVDVGCGTGELTAELLRQSDLYVYGIESDRQQAEAARRRFDALGLHGPRVTILHLEDLDRLPFAGRFAELVVSAKALKDGVDSLNPDSIRAMLCPQLGVACLGRPGELVATRRERLAGAGNWTHFYADAHNSYCGTDTALQGPLELLWFRDTDYEMANRHSMSSPTMVYEGYMVMPGTNGIRVANVYNGRPIWQHDIGGWNVYPGGFSYKRRLLSGNMCVADGKVYARHLDYCLCFDITNGKILGNWKLPQPEGATDRALWGYIACRDGVLYGSTARDDFVVYDPPPAKSREELRIKSIQEADPQWVPNHHHPDSTSIFAMDALTGKLHWTHQAKHSIRNTTISIGDRTVFFIDKPVTAKDGTWFDDARRKIDPEKLAERATVLAKQNGTTVEAELENLKAPRGRIIALDTANGQMRWQSEDTAGFGDMTAVSAEHEALIIGGGGRIALFDTATGKPRWKGGGRDRPMVYENELRFGGTVVDIKTGKRIRSVQGIRGSYCTPVLGSPKLLAFRVGVIGYVDLTAERGTEYFGGIRPGCFIDMTPAGGLLVMSDGASGCSCSYLNQCTIALQPRRPK